MEAAGPYRLSVGGSIDRARAVRFQFDGRAMQGYEGDTLASALLANGVRVVSRSFKFHRPRGVYSCGIEEPNALVQLNSGATAIASARATMVDLHDGLEAFSQSGWPSVGGDVGRVLDFVAPLWAAGFYNKTFIWPNWDTYEGVIRRLGGLGRAPAELDPDRYEARNLHCDVLVIGGGAAGLGAALAAGSSGARVVLVEQSTALGGRRGWDGSMIAGIDAKTWIATTARRIDALPNAQIMTRTVAVGCHDHNVVTLLETVNAPSPTGAVLRERYWIVRAQRVVFATGAIEQPLIFSNNDRPGVLLAGAAHQYLRRHAVAPGRRVFVATNNDSAYALVHALREAGVRVIGVSDTRQHVAETLVRDLQQSSIPLYKSAIPVSTHGFGRLRGVDIGILSSDGSSVQGIERYECDALAISGGWNPTLQLFSQAGGKVQYSERTGVLEGTGPLASTSLVGMAAGTTETPGPAAIRVSPIGNRHRQWVDLRHDVTVADLELAVRENYISIEHVKRYTTVGMSVDQGKTSNVAAIEIVASLRGVPAAQLGHTTMRPPFTPVTLGAIAGRDIGQRFAPHRQLPTHEWHVANGALLEDFGEWKRPAVYVRPGESRAQAVLREARAVRESAGLMDGSSLGKLEIHGPDAREFLDRFYINNLATLKPGRARYGFMLRESGVVFDDGTVVMLDSDHFVITTTSAGSGRVAAWLEEWRQCEWPRLRVAITNVTEQWATISLAGPRAREILSRLPTNIDLSGDAFPHLAIREGDLLGCPARIYRVSFTGELTYEINVPANSGRLVWDALLAAGRPLGLLPFGLDALTLLRLEKGFILIGTDTDGTTVPDDIGWGKTAAAKQRDFIGKRSLLLPEHVRHDRPQLVGLVALDGQPLQAGGHVRLADSKQTSDGWVTSSGRAVLTGESIALAMVQGGRGRVGTTVAVHDMDRVARARIVNPPFLDPAGERMNA